MLSTDTYTKIAAKQNPLHRCVLLALLCAGGYLMGIWLLNYDVMVARGDFPPIYSASQLPPFDLYSQEPLFTYMRLIFGAEARDLFWLYPPPMILLTKPLALLSPANAYLVWGLLTIAMVCASAWSLGLRGLLLAAATLNPMTAMLVAYGQVDGLFLLLFVLAITQLRRPMLAGGLIGLMLLKPQLAVGALLFLLVTRQYKVFAYAGITGLILLLASVAAYGVEPWFWFINQGAQFSNDVRNGVLPWWGLITPLALLESFGAGYAFTIHSIVALAAVVACVLVSQQATSLQRKAGLISTLCLLVPPYVIWAGYMMMLIPVAQALKERLNTRSVLMLAVYSLTPVLGFFLLRQADISIGAIGVVLVLLLARHHPALL